MKKIITLLLVLILILTGCGSKSDKDKDKGTDMPTTDVTPEKPNESPSVGSSNLNIIDYGYVISEDKESLYYTVIMENTHKEKSVNYPKFIASAYDSSGKEITSFEMTLSFIGPDDTVGFTSILNIKGNIPDKIDFVVTTTDDEFVVSDRMSNTKTFAFENIREVKREGNQIFELDIVNNSDTEYDAIALTVVLKKDGKIVAGHTSYPNNIKANDSTFYEAPTYTDIEYDEYVIYAQPWG